MSYITSKVKINANALIGIRILNIAPVTNAPSYFSFGQVWLGRSQLQILPSLK